MEHDEVHDSRSFIRYISQLRAELEDPVRAKDWQNIDLRAFLAAIEAYVTTCANVPAHANPWRHAADLLTVGVVYE
jgi:hypothetical protein